MVHTASVNTLGKLDRAKSFWLCSDVRSGRGLPMDRLTLHHFNKW
ncbi:hypothetical protein BQ8482_480068 [Mesorhizobium delmotii]|uniref:Uncharacterized protein n=1 Tax=Mesorhizobium delmotii TaxID=1631247 RepID=A0A2P9ATU2_9HYPH|nr:hypothetical protein BQ8482_480068 [Mesorhizobium delmotii]